MLLSLFFFCYYSVICNFLFSFLLYFLFFFFFFFNDTATTEIYTLSYTTLFRSRSGSWVASRSPRISNANRGAPWGSDRKSTRLNSSHGYISYAVFCLKKKKKKKKKKKTKKKKR